MIDEIITSKRLDYLHQVVDHYSYYLLWNHGEPNAKNKQMLFVRPIDSINVPICTINHLDFFVEFTTSCSILRLSIQKRM